MFAAALDTAVDGAEFGHAGAQAGGVGGAEARDGADDRGVHVRQHNTMR